MWLLHLCKNVPCNLITQFLLISIPVAPQNWNQGPILCLAQYTFPLTVLIKLFVDCLVISIFHWILSYLYLFIRATSELFTHGFMHQLFIEHLLCVRCIALPPKQLFFLYLLGCLKGFFFFYLYLLYDYLCLYYMCSD